MTETSENGVEKETLNTTNCEQDGFVVINDKKSLFFRKTFSSTPRFSGSTIDIYISGISRISKRGRPKGGQTWSPISLPCYHIVVQQVTYENKFKPGVSDTMTP